MSSGHTLDQALTHAERFLTDSFAVNSYWQDFTSRSFGSSTLWVTAYTGWRLSERQPPPAVVYDAVTHLLANQQPTDIGGWGWGYTRVGFPSDADTTALCALLLDRAGALTEPLAHQIRAFLLEHRRADGGFATFYRSGILAPLPYFADAASVLGWCISHTSVTATVLQALLALGSAPDAPSVADAYEHLLWQQRRDGLWSDYWWIGPQYPTYQAVRAARCLRPRQQLDPAFQATHRALHTLWRPEGYWTGATGDQPCVFATALAIKTLLLLDALPGDQPIIERSVAWLISQQLADGSWPAAEILQIPWPADLSPDSARLKRKAPVTRVFSTATAAAALLGYAHQGAQTLRERAAGDSYRVEAV